MMRFSKDKEGSVKPGTLRRLVENWTCNNNGMEVRDYLGMSQIGRCAVELYEELRNGRPGLGVRGSLGCYEGLLHQRDLLARLEAMELYRPGRVLVAPWSERYRGHTHGELVDPATGAVELLVIKSVTVRRFEEVRDMGRPVAMEGDQVQAYMCYGGYERAMILYKCRETGELWPVPVRSDKERQIRLNEKAAAVLRAVDCGIAPRCGCARCRERGR